jgi:hypothetical protein
VGMSWQGWLPRDSALRHGRAPIASCSALGPGGLAAFCALPSGTGSGTLWWWRPSYHGGASFTLEMCTPTSAHRSVASQTTACRSLATSQGPVIPVEQEPGRVPLEPVMAFLHVYRSRDFDVAVARVDAYGDAEPLTISRTTPALNCDVTTLQYSRTRHGRGWA